MNLKIIQKIGVFFLLYMTSVSEKNETIPKYFPRDYDFPEFFSYANGTYPNATLWRSPWAIYNTKSNNTWDPFNATVHRINDSNAPYWKTPPFYYDGESIFDGVQTQECLYWLNTSNGTNCSFIYGGPYFKSVYSESSPKCLSSLMQSYGLSGMPTSIPLANALCPQILNSCCSRDDFMEAYQGWSNDGPKTEVKNKLEFYINSYLEFLNSMQKAADTATMIGSEIMGTNNCKVLANSISQFDVMNTNGQLSGIVRRTFKYFEKNFESFYCAICDGDNHVHFDLAHQKINYSYKHCRNIVENTLPFLLYLHIYYTRLSNVIVDFTSNCDADGVFKKIQIDESLFRLQIDDEIKKELLDCKRKRNTKNWFKACVPICERYSISRLDHFFLPNLKKMGAISSLVTGNLKIIRNDYLKKIADRDIEVDKTENARILTENYYEKNKNEKSQRKLQQSFPTSPNNYMILRNIKLEEHDYSMIPGSIDQSIDCDKLTPTFDNEGVTMETIINGAGWSDTGYNKAMEDFLQNSTFGSKNLTLHVAQISGSVPVKRKGRRTWWQRAIDLITE